MNFLATSRASSVIPHTENLHQSVSCFFWPLVLCYGLSHCSGKASQLKDATCFLVNCSKITSPVGRVVVVGDEPTQRVRDIKGASWMRSLLMRWVWFGLFWLWRLSLGFWSWCHIQPLFPKVQSCCQQVERRFEQRAAFQQIRYRRFKFSPRKNLIPNFKTKAESH